MFPCFIVSFPLLSTHVKSSHTITCSCFCHLDRPRLYLWTISCCLNASFSWFCSIWWNAAYFEIPGVMLTHRQKFSSDHQCTKQVAGGHTFLLISHSMFMHLCRPQLFNDFQFVFRPIGNGPVGRNFSLSSSCLFRFLHDILNYYFWHSIFPYFSVNSTKEASLDLLTLCTTETLCAFAISGYWNVNVITFGKEYWIQNPEVVNYSHFHFTDFVLRSVQPTCISQMQLV